LALLAAPPHPKSGDVQGHSARQDKKTEVRGLKSKGGEKKGQKTIE